MHLFHPLGSHPAANSSLRREQLGKRKLDRVALGLSTGMLGGSHCSWPLWPSWFVGGWRFAAFRNVLMFVYPTVIYRRAEFDSCGGYSSIFR